MSALVAEPGPDPLAYTAADELAVDRDRLRLALQRLSERQRAVLVLRYWSGLSDAEIASTLEVSLGTVKQHTARALARLRADLDPDTAAPAVENPQGA